ncbi:hypothetical protein LSAT2_001774 [Lamellibrachia satsuma]|nr:hypothetical protein LSAT2_001774 [Lamellibrachia satsuma]
MPAAGAVGGLGFSLNVMTPNVFRSLFAPHDLVVANSLWFTAHLGAGLYIYNRKHIQYQTGPYRIMYSVFGSVIFNFGSVLIYATTKSLLPCQSLRAVAGVALGLVFLCIGKSYLDMVDSVTNG